MKKKIIYGLLLAVAMVTASSSFVSCKDYEGDDYAALKEQNADLRDYLDKQLAAIKQCNCDPTLASRVAAIESDYLKAAAILDWALKSDLDGYAKKSDLAGFLTEHQDLSDYAKKSDLAGFLTEHQDLTGYAKTSDIQQWVKDQFATLINENSTVIESIINNTLATKGYLTKSDLADYYTKAQTDDKLDQLKNYIILGDSLKNAYAWADYSYQRLAALNDTLKQIYVNRDSIAILADSIDNVAAEALKNFNTAKELADSAIKLANEALDSIGKVDTKVSDLKKALADAETRLQNQIDSLNDRVAQTEKDINNILGVFKKQITGVIIQSSYNPVFGTASLPIGLKTNVLAAYVGKNNTGGEVVFPRDAVNQSIISLDEYNYLKGAGVWPEDLTIEDGQTLLADSANAGKLYITVNPTNIDFAGTNFTLVNSRDQEAPVELSPLNPSEKLITWGWTRAAQQIAEESKSGFYEVTANIPEDKIEDVQIYVNKDAIISSVKKAWNERTQASIVDLYNTLYESVEKNTAHQAYAMKAEWTDTTGQHAYISSFDVAVASVAPLSYNFASVLPSSVNRQWLPTFDKQFVASQLHVDPINIDLRTDYEANHYKITATVPVIAFKDTVNVKIDENYNVKDADGNVIGTVDFDYEKKLYGTGATEAQSVDIDVTPLFNQVYGEMNEKFNSVKNLPTTFNNKIDKLVGEVNSYLNEINNVLVRYNSRINGVANRLINAANVLVKPVLLYQGANGVASLSANHLYTPQISLAGLGDEAAITLIPTSYNLDLVTPAYRKSVIVTNVYSTDFSESAQTTGGKYAQALKDANADLNSTKLVANEGGLPTLTFKAKNDYKDMVFEILYTAVDYTGHIAGRKFYFTVVE